MPLDPKSCISRLGDRLSTGATRLANTLRGILALFRGTRDEAADEAEGGLNNLTNGGQEEPEEDPEIVAARLEQEERRKEKHRQMEKEREKMRDHIRTKYNIVKKEDGDKVDGRIGGNRKTPEQVAQEHIAAQEAAQNSIIAQLGMSETMEKASNFITSAVANAKTYWPFGGNGPFGNGGQAPPPPR